MHALSWCYVPCVLRNSVKRAIMHAHALMVLKISQGRIDLVCQFLTAAVSSLAQLLAAILAIRFIAANCSLH